MSESSTLDLTLRLGSLNSNHHSQSPPPSPSPLPPSPPPLPRSSLCSSSVAEGDKETCQPRKKPRMVWTPELHKKFVDVVDTLGEYGSVPQRILQAMDVDGLTRANISSHLQRYRSYSKGTQGNSNGQSNNPGLGERNLMSPMLFPQLIKSRQFEDPHLPKMQHFQHQSQPQQQGVYLGTSLGNVELENPYLRNQSLVKFQRIRTHEHAISSSAVSQIKGTKPVTHVENGHGTLQLFPTDDSSWMC